MKTIQELAKWVIENRYPKSEKEKVSDFEMYHSIIDEFNKLAKCFKTEGENDLIIFLDNLDKRELCRTKSMYFIPLKGEFVDLNSFRLTNTNNGDLKFRYKVDRREFGEGVAYLYMQRCV